MNSWFSEKLLVYVPYLLKHIHVNHQQAFGTVSQYEKA
jgi:hypothetical protein